MWANSQLRLQKFSYLLHMEMLKIRISRSENAENAPDVPAISLLSKLIIELPFRSDCNFGAKHIVCVFANLKLVISLAFKVQRVNSLQK